MPNLTAERLRDLLSYDTETGVFTWKIDRICGRGRVSALAGTEAGCLNSDGYRLIGIGGKQYLAQRLAFLWKTGRWPRHEMDHIDTNKGNNSWVNLRDVTRKVNAQNIRKAPRKKTSNLLGAHWSARDRSWSASIVVDGVEVYLGVFATEIDAHDAYVSAKRLRHEGCTL